MSEFSSFHPPLLRLTSTFTFRSSLSKIIETIRSIEPQVQLEKEPLLKEPTLRIAYIPDAPRFTIRDIFQKIESIDPSWTVSIAHPPSLEERASKLRAREQRLLLLRMIFTFVVAIPTFFLGVVFMSLVKKTNKTRLYMESPMWSGLTTRAQWALFFLATPIMFFGADIFHRRAVHELYVLWKKGSTTPIFRRLTRFGSMNLLVSATTSSKAFDRPMLKGEGIVRSLNCLFRFCRSACSCCQNAREFGAHAYEHFRRQHDNLF
jgi:P-type Cu+ transporter